MLNDGRLAAIDDPMIMGKPGEDVHAEFPAILIKERAVREYQSGGGSFGFRVARGVFRTRVEAAGHRPEPLSDGFLVRDARHTAVAFVAHDEQSSPRTNVRRVT
jgi:hypothetical protein